MFESLSDRLAVALKKLTGRGVMRPEDVDAALREVRMALLEADVNYKVVKEFVERIRARMVGAEVSSSLSPAQHLAMTMLTSLRLSEIDALCAVSGDRRRSHLATVLTRLLTDLQALSDTITHHYLSHVESSRHLATSLPVSSP